MCLLCCLMAACVDQIYAHMRSCCRFSPHLKGRRRMTPKQRLDRVERILGIVATAGRKAREEFREKINILIDTQIRSDDEFREKIKILTDSQIRSDDEFREKIKILTDSQSKTEELTRENSRAISENSKAISENSKAISENSKASKAVNEQLQAVAVAQAELTQSQ